MVFSGTYTDNKNVSGKKAFVGYGPREDSSFRVSAIRKNDVLEVFNVIYTLHNGGRWIPFNNNLNTKNVFFLGCSHVFGDGLNDNRTLPYYFNKFTHEQYNVRNLAFSGYGTHQALKIVENKILKTTRELDTNYVIYSFIPTHIEKAAGFPIWEKNTPNFEVEENQLVYKGSFEDNTLIKSNYLTKRIEIIWRNSYLFKSFFEPKIEKKDVVRVVEMIKKMKFLLHQKNIQFIILINREQFDNEFETFFYENLKKNNIDYYFIDSILKSSNKNIYKIIGDGHPNEKYNEEVAAFLSKEISLKENQINYQD